MLQQVSAPCRYDAGGHDRGYPHRNLFSVPEQTVPGMFTVRHGKDRSGSYRAGGDMRGEERLGTQDRQQDTADIRRIRCVTAHLTLHTYRLCRKLAISQQHSPGKGRLASGILDQLTPMADARQSPLIALTDTIGAAGGKQAGKIVACQDCWRNGTGTF